MANSAELLEQMRQKLEQMQQANRRAEARAAGFDAMNRELAAVEATAYSADRSVTVVAGINGAVKSIQFSDDIERISPALLSQTVMSTLQEAVAEAARKQASVVQEYVGDDIDLVDRVNRTQERIFGANAPHIDRPGELRPNDDGYESPGSIFLKGGDW